MKILVTTPTGNVGRRVLRELMAPEFSVRVIARDPERLPEEIRDEVEVVRGSTDDATVLRRALEGIDALFWCVPTESPQERDIHSYYERFARAGGEAIRQAGTPRVVTLSACGHGSARPAGRISGLHRMEDILKESGAGIRHLRCGAFMENLLSQARPICERGVLSYPMPGHLPVPMVAAGDIADAALRWLVRRDWEGIEAIDVRGPQDVTYSQVAAVFEWVLERPVRYQEASANQYAQFLIASGACAEYARSQVEMFAEMARGTPRSGATPAPFRSATTLAAWIEAEWLPRVESLLGPSKAVNFPSICHA
jgi:uncharacterized protein YbjT (DUF2867 family)